MGKTLFFAIVFLGCVQEKTIECREDEYDNIPNICLGSFGYGDIGFEQSYVFARVNKRWNEFVGYDLIEIGREGRCHIGFGNIDNYAGWYDYGSGEITIDNNFKYRYELLEVIVLHEIGHSLGFNHRKTGSIMCSTAHGDFNDSDYGQCKELGYCE